MSVRILVVDDDPDIRLVLGLQLRRHGWTVREASTGDEALARVRDGDFDAVVLDHRMPGAWGVTTARQLRQAGYEEPILLFSAYLGPEVEDEAAELGIETFEKTSMDTLVEAVREHLAPAPLWRRLFSGGGRPG